MEKGDVHTFDLNEVAAENSDTQKHQTEQESNSVQQQEVMEVELSIESESRSEGHDSDAINSSEDEEVCATESAETKRRGGKNKAKVKKRRRNKIKDQYSFEERRFEKLKEKKIHEVAMNTWNTGKNLGLKGKILDEAIVEEIAKLERADR